MALEVAGRDVRLFDVGPVAPDVAVAMKEKLADSDAMTKTIIGGREWRRLRSKFSKQRLAAIRARNTKQLVARLQMQANAAANVCHAVNAYIQEDRAFLMFGSETSIVRLPAFEVRMPGLEREISDGSIREK